MTDPLDPNSPPPLPVTPPPAPPARPAPALPPARKGRELSFWLAIILFLVLCVSLLVNMGLLALVAGASSASAKGHGYSEKYVEGQGDDKIVLIEVKGVIMDQPAGGLFGGGESLVERTVKQL